LLSSVVEQEAKASIIVIVAH